MERVCANCGREINGEYYKSLDNYLQVNYLTMRVVIAFARKSAFAKVYSSN